MLKFVQSDAGLYILMLTFTHDDTKDYTFWYLSLYRIILKLMPSYTEFYTEW
jgi:hypothetical protein